MCTNTQKRTQKVKYKYKNIYVLAHTFVDFLYKVLFTNDNPSITNPIGISADILIGLMPHQAQAISSFTKKQPGLKIQIPADLHIDKQFTRDKKISVNAD